MLSGTARCGFAKRLLIISAVTFIALLMSTCPKMAVAIDSAQVQARSRFSDVNSNDWYVTSGIFDYVIEKGLLSGYSGTDKFGPYDTISRGQVAVVLYRMAGSPKVSAPAFYDVDYSKYYGDAVNWARKTGVISGYGDTNTFGPDNPVSREQLAVMLYNYMDKIAELSVYENSYEGYLALQRAKDGLSTSRWARTAVQWAMGNGVISGTPSNDEVYVNPQGNAQRCQAAKMFTILHRDLMYGYLVGEWVGDLSSTSPDGSRACYGGSAHPIKLNVKSIDLPGRMAVVDLEFLMHYHATPQSQQGETAGDQVVKLNGLIVEMNYLSFRNNVWTEIYSYTNHPNYDIDMAIDENNNVKMRVENQPALALRIGYREDKFDMVKQ